MRRLVIRPHRPWRLLFELVLLIALVALVGRQLAEHGVRARSASERAALEATNTRLAHEVGRLRDERRRLKEELAIQMRAQQVETKAREDVSGQLKRLQDRLFDLREEVAFYRGIVSDNANKGLDIQTLVIERLGDGGTGTYRFQVVLTRNMNNDKVVTGTVNLSVLGERNGRATQLSLADMSDSGLPDLRFQFKYFQRLEGRLKLPPDFVPQRVLVQVDASGGGPSKVEKSFEWSVTVG